ncbi:hypothetical protein [Faecalicatena contorta]|uniref:Uncharacterized protein n=1 Tax=Faecalicatena contorta TaxID=39482 RepID=A0A315ZX24_9FIRM|nr:hypothetical protein [Faecalicatena contorta]PWJ49134.1 hypothetical protein A8805_10864 [Faecalicatena contorta]SUQ14839.1 hypothetical protein SAMN05216529_10864 [Faecalicatena contorta]
MRTRKKIKQDSRDHYAGLENETPPKRAVKTFKRKPYQAEVMIQQQGGQMEHKDMLEYLAEKYEIGKGVGAGGKD